MKKKKILIIDDDHNFIELTRTLFESHNYKVVAAYNSMEGIQKAKKEKPHLIILDIMMPKMDGVNACKALKDEKKTKDIPIIILTVKWMDEDRDEAMKAGAACYMTKPFETQALLLRIKQIMPD
ncbi:MAG: response regulator [bacterium]